MSVQATSAGRIFVAAVAYFGLVFSAGFVLGAIRVSFMVPRLGVRLAELLEMPLMFVVIIWSARFVIRRFALAPATGVRLSAGLIALALLLGTELAMAYLLQGQQPAEYVASRDAVSGPVYLALLGLFALMPLFISRSGDRNGNGPG